MSYSTRYKAEWRSPMREMLEYTLFIEERGYSGEVDTLYPTDDFITLLHGRIDESELEPIKASELQMTLLCMEEDDPLMELFTLDPLQYRLTLYVAKDNAMNVIWRGYISTGTYSQPAKKPPYKVTICANDGLAVLKQHQFMNGYDKHSGILSIAEVVDLCMVPLEESVIIWGLPPVEPEKYGYALNMSIVVDAIYGMFSEVPTCYDVLTKILENFGLQLYQKGGGWYARPTSVLSYPVRADRFGNEISVEAINLEDPQGVGEGLSTDAVISLQPPLRAINIGDPADVSFQLKRLHNPSSWTGSGYLQSGGWPAEYKGSVGVRFYGTAKTELTSSQLLWVHWRTTLPGTISPTPHSRLSLQAKLYNLGVDATTVHVGVFLVQAVGNADFLVREKDEIYAKGTVFGWDRDKETWSALSTSPVEITEFNKFSVDVQLPKSPQKIMPANKARLSDKSVVDVVFDAGEFNSAQYIQWAIGIAVWWEGSVTRGTPKNIGIELADPVLSVKTEYGGIYNEARSSISVSSKGVEELMVPRDFSVAADGFYQSTMYSSAILNSSKGAVARGVFSSAPTMTLAESVAHATKQLRAVPVRVIDGDVYSRADINLDTIWYAEGRYYYTVYLEHLLKRGLYRVQLRELPEMSIIPPRFISSPSLSSAECVGLESSIICKPTSEDKIYRISPLTGDITLLFTGSGLSLSEGNGCAVVCNCREKYFHYDLIAIDDRGEIISRIDDVLTSSFNGLPILSADDIDRSMRAAKYDAVSETWIIVGNLYSSDSKYGVFLARIGKHGELVSHVENTIFRVAVPYITRVFKGGFLIYGNTSAASNVCLNHLDFYDGDMSLSLGAAGVIAVNDAYMIQGNTSPRVLHRRSGSVAPSNFRDDVLFTAESGYKYVAMNCALVLFSSNLGNALVYDGRTGTVTEIKSTSARTIWVLVGNIVWAINGLATGSIQAYKFPVGSGYIKIVDSEGAQLLDSSGAELMARYSRFI